MKRRLILLLLLLCIPVGAAQAEMAHDSVVFRFLEEAYGEVMQPQALRLAWTGFGEEASAQLGSVRATLVETVCDGMVGYVVVEYEGAADFEIIEESGPAWQDGREVMREVLREDEQTLLALYMFPATVSDGGERTCVAGVMADGEERSAELPFTLDMSRQGVREYMIESPGSLDGIAIEGVELVYSPLVLGYRVLGDIEAGAEKPQYVLLYEDGIPFSWSSHSWMAKESLSGERVLTAGGVTSPRVMPEALLLAVQDDMGKIGDEVLRLEIRAN